MIDGGDAARSTDEVGPLRGATAAFVGDEMLVVQCAVESRRHGLVPVAVVSANPLVLDEARSNALTAVDRRGRDLTQAFADVGYDVLFSIAFEYIIPTELLDRARLAVNFHDGLLPEYGGLNVTTWSILNDAAEHGVTWHVMSQLADRGPILREVRFPVQPGDTAFSLNARCYEAGLASFGPLAAELADGTATFRAQTDEGRRMYRRSERPNVFVDPAEPAERLARAVRAVDVGPRAFGKVGAVRWVLPNGSALVVAAAEAVADTGRPVGAVVADGERIVVQTVAGALSITDLRTPSGERVTDLATLGLGDDASTSSPPASLREALQRAERRLVPAEPRWRERLTTIHPADPALLRTEPAAEWSRVAVPVEAPLSAEQAELVLAVWLGAVAGDDGRGVAVVDAEARQSLGELPLLRPPVVDLAVDAVAPLADEARHVSARVDAALADGPFLADLVARDPALSGTTFEAVIGLELGAASADGTPLGSLADLVHCADGALVLRHRLGETAGQRIAGQLAAVAGSIAAGAGRAADVSLLAPADAELVGRLNDTAVDVDLAVTLDAQFRERCRLAGDAPAVSSRGVTLTYAELGREVERMAALLADAGVTPGATVGIALERSVDMLVAVLGTLTVGAHYLPLDPTYPAERLELMVSDSGTAIVLADGGRVQFDAGAARVLDPTARARFDTAPAPGSHGADALAYVIYTSGSTGRPKGVELEHRQVVNFFAAMDAVIDHHDRSVWLAATSLSFDISVLELLWTVTRGLHVVIQSESGYAGAHAAAGSARPAPARRPGTSMSLFYFAADEQQATSGYRLLLDSARWADAHGFEAVWTPERHFHHFGAPYPNPSVVAAALAVATERIGIRAGSVVAPLHSPVRVAEEWAVVDNLSRGRVGVSFASGWQPNDFVLNPGAYATARESLPTLIDAVKRLWRGETVELPGHDGRPVAVRTLPRPVQPELPVWVTSAGSPSTFERAGAMGANILTHLLGQSVDQLRENIARYRAAWDAAGHPGAGRVTLMLHTYLDRDGDLARETARLPLKGYLGTAVGLLKDFASAFPTFHRAGADADEAFRSLSEDELSQLLDLATERYLTTSGLFGTVAEAKQMADDVLAAGVDEIACLVDFGIDDQLVMQGLDLLAEVHDYVTAPSAGPSDVTPAAVPDVVDQSFADLVEHYGVTHFQCTPSLASMLLVSPRDRAALGKVRHMLVGGEALPLALAKELRELLPGRLTNMYGPTETTIWSLVHEIDAVPEGIVPIGHPIANTQVYVLDDHDRELPVGAFGQLYIGGDGVARGYRDRPELTAERFRVVGARGRLYATGDVARIRPDGIVEFGGRADFQVKIRGHRIELTEIESVLDTHPAVARSVVAARGAGGATLVGFVVLRDEFRGSAEASPDALRAFLAERLPEVMVPSAIGVLDDLPLTPNGKVDRKQLPEVVPGTVAAAPVDTDRTDAQALVAAAWEQHLGRAPGLDDNFFDLGGHSLLAVKLFREFGESYPELALTDIFRYPTVRGFAAHLDALRNGGSPGTDGPAPTAPSGLSRGELRRRARARS